MVRTEERLKLNAVTYNLIRLYNITQNNKNSKEDLEKFCENTSTMCQ